MSVGVGVIGAGVMGAEHARTIAGAVADARLVAVADADPVRAALVADEVKGCEATDEPRALIGADTVEAVLIASPDDTHEALVLACLNAGKPVLCEKPLAPSADACHRVVRAEVKHGRRLVQVGFMRRFDPGYVALKRVVEAGEIGAPLLLHCVHRIAEAPPGFTSEALLTSSATHEIDAARWLLGEEFAAITVHPPKRANQALRRIRDPQFLVLRSRSGVLVDVEVFVNAHYGYDVRCEVVGDHGSASLRPPAPIAVRRAGAERTAVAVDWRDRFTDAYRAQLQSWVDGVAGGDLRGPSAWDGYAAHAVAEAGVLSMGTGGTVQVTLADRPDLYR